MLFVARKYWDRVKKDKGKYLAPNLDY